MKKSLWLCAIIIFYMLVGTLGFSLLPGNQAYALNDITVSVPDSSAASGADISIPIRVTDVSGQDIYAFGCTLTFDSTVLAANGATSAASLSETWGAPTVNTVSGGIQIGAAGSSALAGSGNLLWINFHVKGADGSSTTIHFDQFSFNEGTPGATTVDGNFTVGQGGGVSIITGIFDDFSDGVVSPYWQPEHAEDAVPPFALTEADNMLEIVIDKSMAATSGQETYGFSAVQFNFEADFIMDMTEYPYASVMIKADANVPFQLGVADDSSGTNDVVISNDIVGGEDFVQLYLDFTDMFEGKQKQDRVVKCYLNFKPGYGAAGVFQGTVWLKDFRLGSEALLPTPPPPPPIPPISRAAHPPAIDGVLDDIWKTGPWNRDFHFPNGPGKVYSFQDAAISWRGLYDDTYLYLFVTVNDDTLMNDSPGQSWNDDGVELWFDGDNSKGTTYDGVNDIGIAFLYSGDPDNPLIFNPFTHSGAPGDFSGVMSGATYTGSGVLGMLNLEVAIPLATLGISPTPGYQFGLEVDWNDDDDGGDVDTKVKYFSMIDESWQNPSVLGTVELTDQVQNDYTVIKYTDVAPVVDGVREDAWDVFPTYVLNQYMNTADSISSFFDDLALSYNVVFDSTYLYYGIDVADDKLIQDGMFDWKDDGIEFWFDGNNSKKSTYDGYDDIGIKFSYIEGAPIDSVAMGFGGAAAFDIKSVPWAATATDKGFFLEFALPLDSLHIQPTNGWMVGYEIDYNDDDTGGGKERDTKCKTFSAADDSWQKPSVFGTGLFADAPGGQVPEKPAPLLVDKTTTPPPIDGVLDSTWFNVRNVNMLKFIDTEPDNWFDMFGRFRLMYDSKNLYMFVEVQDDSINNSSPDAYANDGVEIYFDGDNTKNVMTVPGVSAYDAKDDQIRFEYGKPPTGLTGNVQLDNMVYAYKETDFGYNVEIQMPFSKGLTFKAADGLEIGFEVQINDNDTGSRSTQWRWWSTDGNSWLDPSVFGTVKFTGRTTSDILDIHYTAYPIEVDAEMDYAWQNVPDIFVNQRFADFSKLYTYKDAEVNFKTVWNMEYLYFWINVVDDTLHRDYDVDQSWNDDGVELWLDADHSAKHAYDGINDWGFAYRYNPDVLLDPVTEGKVPNKDSTLFAKIKQAQKLTADGLILETAIPMELLGIDPGNGSLIGIDLDWNDDDDGGVKDTKLKTYDPTDNDWQYPDLMGVARLWGSPVQSDVKEEGTLVSNFRLYQNYPNPFNPSTHINFSLPKDSNVKLVIYDVLGREVARLVDGRVQAGEHSINFEASHLSSGLYFYRLQTEDNVVVKKMMFLK